jgi:hypothetical protein
MTIPTRVEYSERIAAHTIPLATSVNAAYKTGTNGKRQSTAALKQFKKEAAEDLARLSYHFDRNPLESGHVYSLTLYAYFTSEQSIKASDADNRIKAAQDAIMAATQIDDRFIYQTSIIKAGVDPFYPRIVFVLERLHGRDLASGLIAEPSRKGF